MDSVFVGIDVAFAKKKRLPLCFCTRGRERLDVIPLRGSELGKPPAGRGNRAALDHEEVHAFAVETLEYLKIVERENEWKIRTIALDCPRLPAENGEQSRKAEVALGEKGILYFTTPGRSRFDVIQEEAKRFLDRGGAVGRLPNANRLWMLVGFELFRVLERHYECREVYPHAIVVQLGCASGHKSTPAGYEAQLQAAAGATGYGRDELAGLLRTSGYGSRHDRLDAFLAAWVASLPPEELEACGDPPNDVIWLPKMDDCGAVRGSGTVEPRSGGVVGTEPPAASRY